MNLINTYLITSRQEKKMSQTQKYAKKSVQKL